MNTVRKSIVIALATLGLGGAAVAASDSGTAPAAGGCHWGAFGSHVRAALTAVQLSIPISGRRLVLGTWQGIYLFEHRRDPSTRDIVLHLLGT